MSQVGLSCPPPDTIAGSRCLISPPTIRSSSQLPVAVLAIGAVADMAWPNRWSAPGEIGMVRTASGRNGNTAAPSLQGRVAPTQLPKLAAALPPREKPQLEKNKHSRRFGRRGAQLNGLAG